MAARGSRGIWVQVRLGIAAALAVLCFCPASAQWTKTGLPVREEARGVAFGSAGAITYGFVGLEQFGVYWSQSTDTGHTWAKWQATGLDEFVLGDVSVNALKTSPSFFTDNLVVAGTADGRVYYSTDLSGSWQAWSQSLGLPFPGSRINEIVFDPSGLYACTDLGLYRSLDNGQHFSAFTPSVPGTGRITGLASNPSGKLWVTTYSSGTTSGGVYLYNGGSWSTLLDGGSTTTYAFNCLAVSVESDPYFI